MRDARRRGACSTDGPGLEFAPPSLASAPGVSGGASPCDVVAAGDAAAGAAPRGRSLAPASAPGEALPPRA